MYMFVSSFPNHSLNKHTNINFTSIHHLLLLAADLVVKEQTNNSYKEVCSKECDPKSERKISTFLFSLFLFYFLVH